MLYSTILAYFLLIGSSFTNGTQIQEMASLFLIHTHVELYITALSQIYEGPAPLQQSEKYMMFIEHRNIILTAFGELIYNDKFPNQAEGLTKSRRQVILEWTDAAKNVIEKCMEGVQLAKDYNPDIVHASVITSSRSLMQRINNDPVILAEFKGRKFPLIDRLSIIVYNFGTPEEHELFESTYRID